MKSDDMCTNCSTMAKTLTAAQASGTKAVLDRRKAEHERDAAKRALEIVAERLTCAEADAETYRKWIREANELLNAAGVFGRTLQHRVARVIRQRDKARRKARKR